jgi:hypothetical protein
MSMFNIPINRLHFIVCIKRANRKNRHNLYDTNLLVSIRNLKNTVTYNRDNQLICTTNYPVKIFAKAGIQKNTGFPRIMYGAGLVKPGMTNRLKFMSSCIEKKGVVPCPGAVLFAGMAANRYYEVFQP